MIKWLRRILGINALEEWANRSHNSINRRLDKCVITPQLDSIKGSIEIITARLDRTAASSRVEQMLELVKTQNLALQALTEEVLHLQKRVAAAEAQGHTRADHWPQPGTQAAALLHLHENFPKQDFTPEQAAKDCGIKTSKGSLRATYSDLISRGKVERVAPGLYRLKAA